MKMLAADGHRSTQITDALTERVIGAVFEVANTLGAGFLEKVYERALLRELRLQGIPTAHSSTTL